jgi:hypothetical protein
MHTAGGWWCFNSNPPQGMIAQNNMPKSYQIKPGGTGTAGAIVNVRKAETAVLFESCDNEYSENGPVFCRTEDGF